MPYGILINTGSSFASGATQIPLEHGFTGVPLEGKDDNVEGKKTYFSSQIKSHYVIIIPLSLVVWFDIEKSEMG